MLVYELSADETCFPHVQVITEHGKGYSDRVKLSTSPDGLMGDSRHEVY